jgi:hypothetical protein
LPQARPKAKILRGELYNNLGSKTMAKGRSCK